MKKLFLILITLLAIHTNVFGVTKVKLAGVDSYIYSEEEFLEPFREELPDFKEELSELFEKELSDIDLFIISFMYNSLYESNFKYSNMDIHAVNREHYEALIETARNNPDCIISASFEAGYTDFLVFHNNKYHFFRMIDEE